MDFIEKQVERAKEDNTKEEENETKTPLMRPENEPLVLDIKLKPKPKLLPMLNIKQEKIQIGDTKQKKTTSSKSINEKNGKQKRSNDSREIESVKKIKSENSSSVTEGWLKEHLMVKVTTKSLGEKYYKAKGITQMVEENGFVAKVKLKSPEEVNGHIIRLDQEYLETVIPAIGKEALILWGKHKGKKAKIMKLHIEHYSVDVELIENKKVVEMLPYEQVCKCVD